MEEWEVIVDTYDQADKKKFLKACKCAKTVLNTELAPSEIDWFLDTLLLEPVNLLSTVGTKWNNNDWLDAVPKALNLLDEVVVKYLDYSSQHFDNIVALCEKSFDWRTKQAAMRCLTSVVRHSETGARNHRVHISALESARGCKAPVAEVVGAICEHHPDLVEGQKISIWRVYLNLLGTPKSDTVVRSLMLGVDGVLKSFGRHLPTADFEEFYMYLVSCRDRYRCKEVYLKLLARHADLIRERLAADAATRLDLWRLLETVEPQVTLARRALLAVYKAIKEVDEEAFQNILKMEVQHRADSSSAHARYTALRVLHATGRPAACAHHDSRSLEHVLKHGRLTVDQAESIWWRVESNVENEGRLLKTALAFHQNLPEKYLKYIAVHGLMQAPDEVRMEAVVFLLNEMTSHLKDEGNIDKYIVLWKSFFDTANGEDAVVVEKCDHVFSDLLDHLQYTLECFVDEAEEDTEEVPEKLKYLLSVSARIIPLVVGVQTGPLRKRIRNVKARVVQLMGAVRQATRRTGAEVVAATRALLLQGDGGFFDVFADVRIDCCDDAEQYESCLALALAPLASVPDVTNVLHALQIIFSHTDADAFILTRSIKTLETLITTYKDVLVEADLDKVIKQVDRIIQINNFKSRDERTLRRNALMFLGKYGKKYDSDNFDIVKHRNRYLTLSFPDLAEGIPIKIHLHSLNELALKFGNPEVLQVAMDLISANSAGRELSEGEQVGISRSACVLLRARAQGRVEALQRCGDAAVRVLLQYAAGERRAAARRAVCKVLQMPALRSSTLALIEEATSLVSESTSKSAVLDIMEMLLNIVKENNTLVQTHLSDIILQVATLREIDALHVFTSATNLMLDKIELFQYYTITNITLELLKLLVCPQQNGGTSLVMADVRDFRRITKTTLEFLKELMICKWKNVYSIVENIFDVIKQNVTDFSRLFYVLSAARQIFEFNVNSCRRVLEDGFIREKLLVEREEDIMSLMSVEGILKFIIEYAEVLLESHSEDTLKLLSNVLKKMQPEQIVQLDKSLSTCIKKSFQILNTTTDLATSFKSWCEQQPLNNIEKNLKKFNFPPEDFALAASLRILLQVFDITDPGFADLGEYTKSWISSLHFYQSRGYIQKTVNYHAYFADLLQVSLKLMTVAEVKAEIQVEGFAEQLMSALFPYLIRKPYLLTDQDLAGRCGLLNYVVKYAVRKCRVEDCCDSVLDLVDQLWPTYDNLSSFKQKHSLLVDVVRLPRRLPPGSNPMRWLTDTIRSEQCTCEMKVKLIGVMPAGEDYKSTWTWFAGQLPARLAEVRGDSALLLGALLDALLAADCSLLDSISQLVSSDTAEGWWNEAIEACTLSLAARKDMSVYETIYSRCWDGLSLGVCNRLMVPLLRCSSVSVCEEFFSRKLQLLLELLTRIPLGKTARYSYQKCVVDYTRALVLLKVAFEVLPEERIKSPKSLLYSRISERVGENLFHLVKQVGERCVVLQKRNVVVCIDDSNLKLKSNCLLFHCENYNCLSAATWCRAPTDLKFYEYLFDCTTWSRIVDPDAQYELPIRLNWQKRTVDRTVSVALDGSSRLLTRTGATRTRTRTRTRTFRSTMSENPLEFDEGLLMDEQEYRQDITVSDNALNRHPCAATLTACFGRGSRLPHLAHWITSTAAATLAAPLHRNAKWLLAQVICNCEEDLKEHASVLCPALFKMVADTSKPDGLLNGLHVDVLNTIIHWRDETTSLSRSTKEDAGATLERLVSTCIHNGRRQKVLEHLLRLLDALLEMYGQVVQIGWGCLTECIEVRNRELAKAYHSILKTITKRSVHVPELLPALLDSLESKQSQLGSADLAQLFGRAVVAAPHHLRLQAVVRYRKLLRDHNRDRKKYIELIYNAQTEYPELCNEEIFEKISNVVFRLVDYKAKCLEILSNRLARLPSGSPESQEVSALLHTPELAELITLGDPAALHLARSALPLMTEELRTRVVVQSAMHCAGADKVRSAAFGVLSRAVQLLFETNETVSNPKRPARFDSPLLKNEELKMPLATLGLGLASDLSGELWDAVSRCLGSTNIVRRFCQCFIIAVHLPSTHATITSPSKLSTCLVVLLELFFREMRANEAFKRALIRDDVMDCLSTTSRNAVGAASQIYYSSEDPVGEGARSVDEVLQALLQFSKKTPEPASAFTLQIMSALKPRTGCGFDFGATMAGLLVPMLGQVSNLTPFAVEACRLFIDECCSIDGFKEAVESLAGSVKGTDGQQLLEVLREDVLMRTSGFGYFALGTVNWRRDDVEVKELSDNFSLEDLVASFDKLSNWEELTLQKKRSVESNLPPLWVDVVKYSDELNKWKDSPSNSWFDKMASVYHKNTYKRLKWFSEMTQWPRSSFSISATVEALELQDEEVPHDLTCEILPSDCLVQWAARIQTRTACIHAIYERMGEEQEYSPSLSHTLRWCACANDRALSRQALRCIEKTGLTSLPWLRQELVARRQLALERKDTHALAALLERAEHAAPSLVQPAPLEDVLGMHYLNLSLRKDVNELSKEKLKCILDDTRVRVAGDAGGVTSGARRMHGRMVQLAVEHYDTMWDTLTDLDQCSILTDISEVLRLAAELNVDVKHSVLLDVLLNRLGDYPGEELTAEAAAAVLGTMESLIHVMDDIALEELTRNKTKLAAHPSSDLVTKLAREGELTQKFKTCLQLVADPKHSLYQYCKELLKALIDNDVALWGQVYTTMKNRIFENPYAGLDYQVLAKHRNTLYDMKFSAEQKEAVRQTLMRLMAELKSNPQEHSLNHLCPYLTIEGNLRGSETMESLSRLLMLPRGFTVVKFEETVVFAASARRPGTLVARLSDGRVRRLLVKCGERLHVDACALRFVRALPLPHSRAPYYQVTPLGEDSGLIEYLEDHVTVLSMVEDRAGVAGAQMTLGNDAELVLKTREDSVAEFEQVCRKVPAHVLRSVVEQECGCVEEFIGKKRCFEESLAVMTLVSWLLGLKDRHLGNVMYCRRDGSVRCVDWNPSLQHGRGELPAARLTRALLALCRLPALESRLQQLTAACRDSHQLLVSSLRVSYKRIEETKRDELADVVELLRGAVLPHQVSVRARMRAPGRYTSKYVEILQQIFSDFHETDVYTVEEQVTNLLRHCTDPQILSITRSAWEPWL